MLCKRIIPCLDVKDGRTVKGINFKGLRDAGHPVELAERYAKEGADELVFLDISATLEGRKTMRQTVLEVAEAINIPFTVGGGISSVDDVEIMLKHGADKVSVNSAALRNPDLINELSAKFGNQCIVVAIDAKFEDSEWKVYSSGGTLETNYELFSWAKEVEERGAGELLFTSMNNDGTKQGFANAALKKLGKTVNIPIIASGGAGDKVHFLEAFKAGKADAALAASVFHYGEIPIPELKIYLKNNEINIRI